MLAGKCLRESKLFVGIGQAVEQERPGNGQELGDLWMGQPVGHGVGGSGRGHHPMPAQRGEVLGQVGCLKARLGQQVADGSRVIRCSREQFEHADPRRVGEGLEQVRLDLVERGLRR